MALVATLAVPLSLFSQWLSFFVSTLEALNFQPEGLANPSAEGWWPRRGDVFPSAEGVAEGIKIEVDPSGTGKATAMSGVAGVVVRLVRLGATAGVVAATRGWLGWCVVAVAVSCSRWQSFIPLVSTHSPSSLFLRNRGDWRRIEPMNVTLECHACINVTLVEIMEKSR